MKNSLCALYPGQSMDSFEKGFTLIEMLVVTVIVGIIVTIALTRYNGVADVQEIQADNSSISSFFKARKLEAFTTKEPLNIILNGDTLESRWQSDIDASTDDDHLRILNLENSYILSSTPITINSRGIPDSGSIHLAAANPGARHSCVVFSNMRIRLGEWNSAKTPPCTAE